MSLPVVALSDLLSISRSGSATVINLAGQRADLAAGAPRLDFSGGLPRGVLIEGPDTNFASNPRFAGLIAGTAPTGSPPTGGTTGTPPTGLTVTGGLGVNAQIVGVQQVAGDDYLAVRYYGNRTAASTTAGAMTAAFPYAVSDTLNVGLKAVLLAGSASGLALLRCGLLAGGVSLTGDNRVADLSGTPIDLVASKAPASGGADGTAQMLTNLNWTVGQQVDMTIGFGAPYAIKSGRPGQSLIRPATAAVGSTVRARDDVRFTRVDWFDWARVVSGANAGATVALEFMLQQVGAAGDQGLLRIDDGTAANRMEFWVKAGTNQIWARRVIGGSTVAEVQLGTCQALTPFRLVLAGDAGAILAVVAGGDLVPVPLGGAFTAARALLGSITTDDTTSMWGWLRYGWAYPKRRPNAEALLLTTLSPAAITAEGNA